MSTTTDNLRVDEATADAVLAAFAQATEAPGGAKLADWIARHPGHAGDLARLAADRWAGDTMPASAATAARMQSIGMAALRACRPAPVRAAAAAPMTSLLATVKAAGLTADTLSAKLDLPVALFWKLHRRLIAADSVPRALVADLADTVNRTLDEMAAYLRMPPQLAAGASYRSDDAPEVGAQETFAEALQSEPEATDAQRRRWLNTETL